jgi:hypothetical protein
VFGNSRDHPAGINAEILLRCDSSEDGGDNGINIDIGLAVRASNDRARKPDFELLAIRRRAGAFTVTVTGAVRQKSFRHFNSLLFVERDAGHGRPMLY